MTVGQVLSATESQNSIDSKIKTFIQQSTKARESVAVFEKIENDLDSMEAEAENLKDQITNFGSFVSRGRIVFHTNSPSSKD